MRDRRQFVRFDVASYTKIKASVVDGPIGERLMTVSKGGAGFWAPAEDCRIKLGERVRVRFFTESAPEAKELRGEVLYILPHPLDSQIGRFYGIRFDEAEQVKIQEAVEELQGLFQLGKIKEA